MKEIIAKMRFTGLATTGAVFMVANNIQPVEAVVDTMWAVMEFFFALDTLAFESATWENLLLNMQNDVTDIYSDCQEAFTEYVTLWDEVLVNTADNTAYSAGLTTKGNGTPTTAGYWMYCFE